MSESAGARRRKKEVAAAGLASEEMLRRDSTTPPWSLGQTVPPEPEPSADSAETEVAEARAKVKKSEGKARKMAIRGVMSIVMIGLFAGIIWAGPAYLCIMVIILQCLVFRELVNVRYARYNQVKQTQTIDVPLFRTLQWYWFLVAMFYVYTDFVTVFSKGKSSMVWIAQLMHTTPWLTFMLFSSAFVISIFTLRPRKDTIRYQMGHLAWTVVTLVMVCGQMFYSPRIAHLGMFWFVVPAFLVVINDMSAYAWGMMLGKKLVKRPFLSLSPNKTWEGFFGALFTTTILAVVIADSASNYTFLTCPSTELTLELHPDLQCTMHPVFVEEDIDLPLLHRLSSGVIPAVVRTKPIVLHAIQIALVASLVAPFGGFLASAIKRANGVKDFDSVIPGHGGFTDRFDCQMLMSLYVWVHYKSFVLYYASPAERIITKLSLLSVDDQQNVAEALQKMLQGGA